MIILSAYPDAHQLRSLLFLFLMMVILVGQIACLFAQPREKKWDLSELILGLAILNAVMSGFIFYYMKAITFM